MITIDWGTKVISVPKSSLTLIQSTPVEILELSINAFRLELKELEASLDGIVNLRTHNHNTEVLLGGIVYARIVEIINGYTITFEDGQYAVNLVGANSNIGDVVNVNQVSVRSQNSAGLISNQAIEFSSFDGGVTIDVDNLTGKAVAGTVFPTGTRQAPVNNLIDLNLIATRRGLTQINVIGDLTLSNEASWDRYSFIGESQQKTTLQINTEADVTNCEYFDATIQGVLDGGSHIEQCIVDSVTYVDGDIFNCAIGPSPVTLASGITATFYQCYTTVLGVETPTIDLGGTGQVALRDYKGGMFFTNFTGDTSHSIDLFSGQIKLDSTTISGGTFVVRGIGKLIDENGIYIPSGNWNSGTTTSGVTIINELLNTTNITRYLDRKVYVDTSSLINGDGSSAEPFNNIVTCLDFAQENIITQIVSYNEITLDRTLNNCIFIGVGNKPIVNLNNQNLSNCEFRNLSLRGIYSNSIEGLSCELDSGLHLDGFFENCGIKGNLHCGADSLVSLIDCYDLVSGGTFPSISMDSHSGTTTCELEIRNYSGSLDIKDCNTTGDTCTIEISQGAIFLENSNTDGNITIRGIATLVNQMSGTTLDIAGLLQPNDLTFSADTAAIAAAVWNKLTSDHEMTDTFGKLLSDLIVKADQQQQSLNVNTELLKNKPNNP